jgi:hypothetical protein
MQVFRNPTILQIPLDDLWRFGHPSELVRINPSFIEWTPTFARVHVSCTDGMLYEISINNKCALQIDITRPNELPLITHVYHSNLDDWVIPATRYKGCAHRTLGVVTGNKYINFYQQPSAPLGDFDDDDIGSNSDTNSCIGSNSDTNY